MSENNDTKIGCWGTIIGVLVICLIINGIKTCNRAIRKHHEVVFTTHSIFHRVDDKSKLTLEFYGKDYGSIYYIYDSEGQRYSSIPPMYFKIKNGDVLYDKTGEYIGYIKVLKDGSFKIKDSDMFNGHYVSLSGDKARNKE